MNIIEQLKKILNLRMKEREESYVDNNTLELKNQEDRDIIEILDTLQEQPVCEGLDDEIARMWAKSCHLNEKKDQRIATLTSIEFEELARHFAEWQKDKDTRDMYMSDNRHFQKIYELGRKEEREQMMTDAVEGEVIPLKSSMEILIPNLTNNTYKVGDKVKLVIIKKD